MGNLEPPDWYQSKIIVGYPSWISFSDGQVQSTLGFAIMDIAANLDLATAKALTDLHEYINSDLVFSDLKFRALYSEMATVEVVIPSGLSLDLSNNYF